MSFGKFTSQETCFCFPHSLAVSRSRLNQSQQTESVCWRRQWDAANIYGKQKRFL